MLNSLQKNPSLKLESLIPDLDNENFLKFIEAYYKWMESTKLTYIQSTGTFSAGNTVVGQESNAVGIVKYVSNEYLVVEVRSEEGFYNTEQIVESQSGIEAALTKAKDNVIRAANNLVKNKTFQYASGDYWEYLKNELNDSVPSTTSAQRKLIAERIREFYTSKSSEAAYEFFFKAFFNSEVVFRYPGEELLRVSDGRFEQLSILRIETTYEDPIEGTQQVDPFVFLNRTIRGDTSQAVANVINVVGTALQGVDYYELRLSLVSGEFSPQERIRIIGEEESQADLFGIIARVDIVDGGSGYSVGDPITITSGFVSGTDLEFPNIGNGVILRSYNGTDLSLYEAGDIITISGTSVTSLAIVADNLLGNNQLVVASTAGFKEGSFISDDGVHIIEGTTIVSVDDATTLTISQNKIPFASDRPILCFNNDRDYTVVSSTSTTIEIEGVGVDDQDFFDYDYQPASSPLISIQAQGAGFGALAFVSSIDSGGIGEITISNPGYGYQSGTRLTIDNGTTGGSGLIAEVGDIIDPYTITDGLSTYTVGEIGNIVVRNRGTGYISIPSIALVDDAIANIGAINSKVVTIDNPGTGYSIGDVLTITAPTDPLGTTPSAIVSKIDSDDAIIFEDGDSILLEGTDSLGYSQEGLIEDGSPNTGAIVAIEFSSTGYGSGYTNNDLPTITATSGNNDAEFTVNNILGTSGTVDVANVQENIGLGAIRQIDIENAGLRYANAEALTTTGNGDAILTPTISGIAITPGQFLTTDGLLNDRIIQDSFFFQDFSYVLRTGTQFNQYSKVLKELLHPAGTEFFGEILFTSFISVTPEFYSQIRPESAITRIVFLEELLSFTGATYSTIDILKFIIPENVIDVVSGATATEMNVEIQLVKNAELNYHSAPVEVEMRLDLSAQSLAGPSYLRRHLDIQSGIDVFSNNTQEYQIEIAPSVSTPMNHRGTEVEIDFEILSTSSLNIHTEISPELSISNVVSVSNAFDLTEYNIEIRSFGEVSPQYYKDTAVEVEFQIPFVSPLNVYTSDIDIEIGVTTFASVSTLATQEYQIKIAPEKSIANVDYRDTETKLQINPYILAAITPQDIRLQRFVDIETDLAYIAVSPSIEIQPIVESFVTTNGNPTFNETTIDCINLLNVGKVVPVTNETVVRVGTTALTPPENVIPASTITYGELQLWPFRNDPISNWQNIAFEDVYPGGRTVMTQVAIAGTVSVSGTTVTGSGTSFTQEFVETQSLIIDNEEFIIINITDDTTLEINVVPTGSYTNVAAYREFIL